MGEGGRIFAMTSAGSTRAQAGYGVISAAKAALEAYIRQLALELAPKGITANTIRAGVTETAAFHKIPGSAGIAAKSLQLSISVTHFSQTSAVSVLSPRHCQVNDPRRRCRLSFPFSAGTRRRLPVSESSLPQQSMVDRF